MCINEANKISLKKEPISLENNPNVVSRFQSLLRSTLNVRDETLRAYTSKLIKLLKITDIELALISLVVEVLEWSNFSGRIILPETDLKLFDKQDLKEVYYLFFQKDSFCSKNQADILPVIAVGDIAVFFQLFYVFIFAKRHLNSVLTINIDSEEVSPKGYHYIYMNYSIWLNVTPIKEHSISCIKINERFNKLRKEVNPDSSNNRGDLNVVLDLIFKQTK